MSGEQAIEHVLGELLALHACDAAGQARLRAALDAARPLLPQLLELGVEESLVLDAAALAFDVPLISVRAVMLGKIGRAQPAVFARRAIVFGERGRRLRVAYADVLDLPPRPRTHDAFLAGPALGSLLGGVRLVTHGASAEPDWGVDKTDVEGEARRASAQRPRSVDLGSQDFIVTAAVPVMSSDDDRSSEGATDEVKLPFSRLAMTDADEPSSVEQSEIESWDPD